MYLRYKIVLLLCYIVIVVIQKYALLCTLCCLVISFFSRVAPFGAKPTYSIAEWHLKMANHGVCGQFWGRNHVLTVDSTTVVVSLP